LGLTEITEKDPFVKMRHTFFDILCCQGPAVRPEFVFRSPGIGNKWISFDSLKQFEALFY
jgi:hypothetical protein